MKKKQQQQHPGGGGADPWPHGAPLGGAPPGLGSWKRWVSLLPFLRFSLRDYGFCMATLLVFCLGSLFYQLGGGPPRFLLDLRQYLGKEGRRARGRRRRREVVRGGGEGSGGSRGTWSCLCRRLPGAPQVGRPRAFVRRPRAPTASCVSVCLRRGWGAAGLTCRAGTPGRGAAYLPPLPPRSGTECRRVSLWVCMSVCIFRPGGEGLGTALPCHCLVTTAPSRPAVGRVERVGLAPPYGRFCEFCPT